MTGKRISGGGGRRAGAGWSRVTTTLNEIEQTLIHNAHGTYTNHQQTKLYRTSKIIKPTHN